MQIDALRDSPLPLWQQPLFRRFVRTLAGLAIAAGFGYFFVSRGNLDQIDDSLERVNIGLVFLAVGVYFLNIGFQAIRWNYLIRHLGSPGPRRLLPAMLIGVMGNNILPLRMGMVLRAEYLWSRFRINAPALFSSVLLEGWLDGVVLAIVFVPALVLVGTEEGIIRGVVISGGIAAGALLILRLGFSQRFGAFWGRRSESVMRWPSPAWLKRLVAWLVGAFASGLVSVRDNYTLAMALVWTAAAWLARAVELYIVGLAFGLDQPFPDYLALTAALSAAGIVQISPGNTGPYEFVVAEVLTSVGVARGDAAAYAIVSHLVLFLPVTIVGGLIFAWHRLTLPGLIRSRRVEAAVAKAAAAEPASERSALTGD
ncbi:MAG TPA: lysylphosphatidylglycerol synthase transmembrane domain-containing protein [Dehalococcoidia bacterium]|nr:lysylphosphatidylglycerol synthase transmembrane domain-containing protein [Dehalococcoidia bacterium]